MTDTPNSNHLAACTGKDKLTAFQAYRLASRTGRDAYKCPVCGHWHVGGGA